ncbi:MAG: hypothetical protein OXB88_07045 [Bacteriovoracales bacterium]|nr:hypothetical protein [Bacteriovoracales bacterium]
MEYTLRAVKQLKKLPTGVKDTVLALVMDITEKGPVRGDWPNFSKLNSNECHCHLKKGRPTYVACWRILDKKNKIIEIYYVGTHEKAPY